MIVLPHVFRCRCLKCLLWLVAMLWMQQFGLEEVGGLEWLEPLLSLLFIIPPLLWGIWKKYWMTVSFSIWLMSGIYWTTDVTEGAALKSVLNAVWTLFQTVVSIPKAVNLSNQSNRSPLNHFLHAWLFVHPSMQLQFCYWLLFEAIVLVWSHHLCICLKK